MNIHDTMSNPFYNRDILDAVEFNHANLEYLMPLIARIKSTIESGTVITLLRGRILAALFYEPSSRTFGSFVAAMQRLGGGFIPLQGMGNSSVIKGETLTDTIRTFANYADAIVLRHSEVGSAKIAAEFSDKPILNAGDGIGEHPTQAPQDIFTIRETLGLVDDFHIVFLGDLGHYRNVNSLVKALSNYKKIRFTFVSPKEVRIQDHLHQFLKERKADFREIESLDAVIAEADVVYVTRVKKEYMTDKLYQKIQGQYVIDKRTLAQMKKKSIVMHPFPRVGEIAVEVDLDDRAVYIRQQMRNGMYARMALLASILVKEVKL